MESWFECALAAVRARLEWLGSAELGRVHGLHRMSAGQSPHPPPAPGSAHMRFASTAVLALTLTAAMPALALAQTQVTTRGDVAGATTFSWSAVGATPSTPFTVA